ncbi:MAG: TonB-dependent receptor [Candidatus Kapabacteria bacterium]|nr:TonB-dependent receptor [Candidatus Kapabacteria bacterium]
MHVAVIVAILMFGVAGATAQDSIHTYRASDVVVHADPLTQPWRQDRSISTTASIDDLMRFIGLSLVQRANGFAGEVTMMGLRGGQVSTTIDGMKIHAACVDKMDPATAYVEVDNVATMHVNTVGSDLRYGQQLGGSLNFLTQQPRYASPLHSTLDLSMASNAFARRVRVDVGVGSDDVAIRAGYTQRSVDNMVAANGVELPLSGYAKQNLHVSAGWRLREGGELVASVIADHAHDVGYPSLLMDTRRADALIGSVTWRERWSQNTNTSLKLYANSVNHVMDDYQRPTSEIASRSFMPSMYMPMYGTTSVIGALFESTITSSTSVTTLTVDATSMAANATMDMVPFDTSVAIMQMTNIGDVRVQQIGLTGSYDVAVNCDLSLQATARADIASRSVQDPSFRSMLSGYYPGALLDGTKGTVSATIGGTYDVAEDMTCSLTAGYAQRMPTHLELYGFMVFDPQSGIVTYGNPGLRNESALSATARFTYRVNGLRITGSGYVRMIDDYIAPNPAPNLFVENGLPARSMANIGRAVFYGFDLSSSAAVASWWSTQGAIRATWGVSERYRDPLPFIAPVSMTWRNVLGTESLQAEMTLTAAVGQPRASQVIQPEDTTPSWWRADVLVAWQVLRYMRLQCGMTNLTNRLYHEHTSINNIPVAGRAVHAGLRIDL